VNHRRASIGLCVWILVSQAALGCSEEQPTTRTAPPQAQEQTAPASPSVDSVLEGTDLVPFSNLELVPLDPATARGSYVSEQGGSLLLLEIETTADGVNVRRTYQEPEQPDQTRNYTARIEGDGASAPSEGFYLRATRQGVLVLELSSQADSVPKDYWVHYIRKS